MLGLIYEIKYVLGHGNFLCFLTKKKQRKMYYEGIKINKKLYSFKFLLQRFTLTGIKQA